MTKEINTLSRLSNNILFIFSLQKTAYKKEPDIILCIQIKNVLLFFEWWE